MAVDEKEKSVCPMTVILALGSGILTMSESVATKLQAAVPDVQIVEPVTDDQYLKIADGKLVPVSVAAKVNQ